MQSQGTAGAGLAVVRSAPAGLSPIRTPDDLAAAFLLGYGPATREAYARDLRAWSAWLMKLGVDPMAAHRAHVELWMREQEMAGAAPATISRRLAAVSDYYAYAVDEDMIRKSPMTRIRRPRTSSESPRSGLDRDEVRAVLATAEASSPRDRALVTLLVLSGTRVSESLGADVGDLDHERGHRVLRVHRKGGKVQRLALAPRTATAIDALLDGRTEGPIFATRTGRRMDRHAACKVIRRLARTAGVERSVSPHTLRHTFATLALDAGVALHVVQDGCGHAAPRTTQRYNSNRDSLDKAATHTLAAFLAS